MGSGGLAHNALPQLDAHTLDLGGVAGLEAHAQVAGAVVDQEDGEDAKVDDGADQVGNPVHEGVEVEGGVEGVGQAQEEVELEGLEADVRRGGVRMEERLRLGSSRRRRVRHGRQLGLRRAVVAFKGLGVGDIGWRWCRVGEFGSSCHRR